MTAADHANTVRILRESLDNAAEAFVVDGRHVLAREMRQNLAALDALQTQAETAEEWRKEYMAAAHALSERIHRSEAAEAERDHARDALRRCKMRAIDARNECDSAPQDFFLQDIERIVDAARAALGEDPWVMPPSNERLEQTGD